MPKMTRSERRAARELAEKEERKKRYESILFLPSGAYRDSRDDMLHLPDGSLLPDDLYRTEDGGLFLYEGNFMNRTWEVDE